MSEQGHKHDEDLEGYARYRHLRANVRQRRSGYKAFIFLAIVVFLVSIVDILFLDNVLQFGVYGAYAILFIWGLIMLFSRQRDASELEEAHVLERQLMQCPECKNIFQYGEVHWHDRQKSAFSCPICGAYGALPDDGSEPVKALPPEGDLKEFAYECRNCNEEMRVGTFGEDPIHVSLFRTCPRCGQKGTIERVPLPEKREEYGV